jgi:hypothetical protein
MGSNSICVMFVPDLWRAYKLGPVGSCWCYYLSVRECRTKRPDELLRLRLGWMSLIRIAYRLPAYALITVAFDGRHLALGTILSSGKLAP